MFSPQSQTLRLEAVLVGKPQTYGRAGADDPLDRPWTSAIHKSAVDGPTMVHPTHVEGDQVADLKHHGGIDQAVLAYSADHLGFWRQHLSPELKAGGFGENFSISGQDERSVCIGDRYALGEAEVQVSHPRQPCWVLERRWRKPGLMQTVVKNGKCGWYMRVLRPGLVAAGQELVLLERPHPAWTISRGFSAWFKKDQSEDLAMASLPSLGAEWRRTLMRRAGATQDPAAATLQNDD